MPVLYLNRILFYDVLERTVDTGWSHVRVATDHTKGPRMDFSIPQPLKDDVDRTSARIAKEIGPQLPAWYREGKLPREFFTIVGEAGGYGFELDRGRIVRRPALREALLTAALARLSGGAAVAALAHADLGVMGLCLFGGESLQHRYGGDALSGRTVMCIGNTENQAGSDVAAVATRAEPLADGWRLTGTKSYVTNGAVADLSVVTAVTDPDGPRTGRLSMFLVDLHAPGVVRTPLNKQVWIPSDLTRIELRGVFVPRDHLLGEPGRGLQQVLRIFTHSRVAIAALALGTAAGAFDLGVRRALARTVFGRPVADYQAKSFEVAELHAAIESARLALYKACWRVDRGEEFRAEASLAKYLSVAAARRVSEWAADLFGAASVVREHPVHKFPMDAWGASLGEGTQDVQKLIIFRELMKQYRKEK
jgi:alkylation response protein AidB-like acyl-CoA dehydrogenase